MACTKAVIARHLHSAIAAVVIAGCAVNPVTGQRELSIISTEQQINMGAQQYGPAQQMQGGDYLVDPGVTAYVQQVGARLAAVSDVALPYEFVVLNNSVPNAWALPGGKIAVNRGLLVELRNEAELAAVLGHEIVHAAARHGARRMERGMLLQGAMVAAAIGTRNQEYSGAALGVAQQAAGLMSLKYGRDDEREGDYYGTRYMAKAGYDPQAAVTLQEIFLRLAGDKESSWMQGLLSTHPPSAERVSNNRSLVAQLRAEGFQGGEFAADRYEQAIGPLKRDAPAYQAYDAAQKALHDKDNAAALASVNSAIELQDKEAAFYGLRGDIRYGQKQFDDAISDYDQAIQRDPEYFAYYLGRGMAHSRQKQRQLAKVDLDRSVELLPTAVAYAELGRIAERDGDTDTAVRYYAAASQSESAAGRAAYGDLLRLDLPRQPAQYVQARVAIDKQGQLLLQVSNTTPVRLEAVSLQVELRGADGRILRFAPTVGRLEPQASAVLRLPDPGVQIVEAQARAVAVRPAQ